MKMDDLLIDNVVKPLKLKNRIQKYAWGSHSAIQQLQGKPPSEEPWAELWMGTHPKAPSQVFFDNQWVPLDNLISQWPEKILGETSAKKFDNTLPYLFKILAAEQPLSIQAHPNKDQAIAGFHREEKTGPPIDDATRNYRDSNHKPECICALTSFTGLKGFRRVSQTSTLLNTYCPATLKEGNALLKSDGLKAFFNYLMNLPDSQKSDVIDEAVAHADKSSSQQFISDWLIRLHHYYPSDIGVISPLFLNLFCLEPGQALFLKAGELHAYLEGLGIELMANSDNVLRGGLTPKHVDISELLNVLNFEESDIQTLLPNAISETEGQYPVMAEEFVLSTICVNPHTHHVSSLTRNVEILLCISGRALLYNREDETDFMNFAPGEAIFVPADANAYRITGDAVIYKAGVPF